MKVLFLDIDGVLNSAEYMRERRTIRRPTAHAIDAPTVPRLNAITDRTGAKIVVSSSWRLTRSAERLAEILAVHGVTGEVIGATPQLIAEHPGFAIGIQRERGHEIQAWLDEHAEVTHFAIVDDCSDMVHLAHRHVKTSWERGLQDEHVERLVELLGEGGAEGGGSE